MTFPFMKMEDNLNFFENGRRPKFNFKNGRRPQIFFQMEDDLKHFRMEDKLNFFLMEDDL